MDQMSFFPFQYNQYNTKNNLIEKKRPNQYMFYYIILNKPHLESIQL